MVVRVSFNVKANAKVFFIFYVTGVGMNERTFFIKNFAFLP